jgi:ABC-2 type transport system permease protein
MRGFLAIVRRELLAYFFSPLAYVILTTFLLVFGAIFQFVLGELSDPRKPPENVFPILFGNIFTWLILILYCSTLTMRLLAEDRKSGAIESLLTAPVTEWGVVLGKYLGACLFYVVLWLPTLVYVLVLSHFSTLDYGPIWGGYLGVLLIGLLFLAVGTFASSLFKNQVVAAIVSFSMLLVIWAGGALVSDLLPVGPLKSAFEYANLLQHMGEFGKGVVDTRRLVFYGTGAGLFLYLTVRSLEVRKWR